MGSVEVMVKDRKVVEKSGLLAVVSATSDTPSPVGCVAEPSLLVLLAARVVEVVARRTCIRSFFNCSSAAAPWSLLPAQLTRRRLRLTRGLMLLPFSFLKVRVWSSGTSFAGGVDGVLPLPAGDEGVLRCCGKVGEDGESCDTKASADCEKTKPRCSRALVTVRRDREGTRM